MLAENEEPTYIIAEMIAKGEVIESESEMVES